MVSPVWNEIEVTAERVKYLPPAARPAKLIPVEAETRTLSDRPVRTPARLRFVAEDLAQFWADEDRLPSPRDVAADTLMIVLRPAAVPAKLIEVEADLVQVCLVLDTPARFSVVAAETATSLV